MINRGIKLSTTLKTYLQEQLSNSFVSIASVWKDEKFVAEDRSMLEQYGYYLRTVTTCGDGAMPLTEPMEMTHALNAEGEYIGNKEDAEHLCVTRGIRPECIPGNKVCSIGYCEKDSKWYGWSHRAIFGFETGMEVKEGDAIEGLPIGFVANTKEDCKKMASAFADSVSSVHEDWKTLAAGRKPNPMKFTWYKYKHTKKMHFKQDRHNPEIALELEPDEIFGLRVNPRSVSQDDKYILLHKDAIDQKFFVNAKEVKRLMTRVNDVWSKRGQAKFKSKLLPKGTSVRGKGVLSEIDPELDPDYIPAKKSRKIERVTIAIFRATDKTAFAVYAKTTAQLKKDISGLMTLVEAPVNKALILTGATTEPFVRNLIANEDGHVEIPMSKYDSLKERAQKTYTSKTYTVYVEPVQDDHEEHVVSDKAREPMKNPVSERKRAVEKYKEVLALAKEDELAVKSHMKGRQTNIAPSISFVDAGSLALIAWFRGTKIEIKEYTEEMPDGKIVARTSKPKKVIALIRKFEERQEKEALRRKEEDKAHRANKKKVEKEADDARARMAEREENAKNKTVTTTTSTFMAPMTTEIMKHKAGRGVAFMMNSLSELFAKWKTIKASTYNGSFIDYLGDDEANVWTDRRAFHPDFNNSIVQLRVEKDGKYFAVHIVLNDGKSIGINERFIIQNIKTNAEAAAKVKLAYKKMFEQPDPDGDKTVEASEHHYGLQYRPADIGAVPSGNFKVHTAAELGFEPKTWGLDDRAFRHGVITYDRELTEKEVTSFQLVDLQRIRKRDYTANTVEARLAAMKHLCEQHQLTTGDALLQACFHSGGVAFTSTPYYKQAAFGRDDSNDLLQDFDDDLSASKYSGNVFDMTDQFVEDAGESTRQEEPGDKVSEVSIAQWCKDLQAEGVVIQSYDVDQTTDATTAILIRGESGRDLALHMDLMGQFQLTTPGELPYKTKSAATLIKFLKRQHPSTVITQSDLRASDLKVIKHESMGDWHIELDESDAASALAVQKLEAKGFDGEFIGSIESEEASYVWECHVTDTTGTATDDTSALRSILSETESVLATVKGFDNKDSLRLAKRLLDDNIQSLPESNIEQAVGRVHVRHLKTPTLSDLYVSVDSDKKYHIQKLGKTWITMFSGSLKDVVAQLVKHLSKAEAEKSDKEILADTYNELDQNKMAYTVEDKPGLTDLLGRVRVKDAANLPTKYLIDIYRDQYVLRTDIVDNIITDTLFRVMEMIHEKLSVPRAITPAIIADEVQVKYLRTKRKEHEGYFDVVLETFTGVNVRARMREAGIKDGLFGHVSPSDHGFKAESVLSGKVIQAPTEDKAEADLIREGVEWLNSGREAVGLKEHEEDSPLKAALQKNDVAHQTPSVSPADEEAYEILDENGFVTNISVHAIAPNEAYILVKVEGHNDVRVFTGTNEEIAYEVEMQLRDPNMEFDYTLREILEDNLFEYVELQNNLRGCKYEILNNHQTTGTVLAHFGEKVVVRSDGTKMYNGRDIHAALDVIRSSFVHTTRNSNDDGSAPRESKDPNSDLKGSGDQTLFMRLIRANIKTWKNVENPIGYDEQTVLSEPAGGPSDLSIVREGFVFKLVRVSDNTALVQTADWKTIVVEAKAELSKLPTADQKMNTAMRSRAENGALLAVIDQIKLKGYTLTDTSYTEDLVQVKYDVGEITYVFSEGKPSRLNTLNKRSRLNIVKNGINILATGDIDEMEEAIREIKDTGTFVPKLYPDAMLLKVKFEDLDAYESKVVVVDDSKLAKEVIMRNGSAVIGTVLKNKGYNLGYRWTPNVGSAGDQFAQSSRIKAANRLKLHTVQRLWEGPKSTTQIDLGAATEVRTKPIAKKVKCAVRKATSKDGWKPVWLNFGKGVDDQLIADELSPGALVGYVRNDGTKEDQSWSYTIERALTPTKGFASVQIAKVALVQEVIDHLWRMKEERK